MPRGLSKNKQSHKEQTWERATGSVPESKLDREMNAGTILSSRAELLCASMVFLAALLLYSWTLAPTVSLVDRAQLIVVARGLGVAQSPRFRLWVLIAHLESVVS